LGECVRKALGGSKLTSRISVDPHPVSLM
jgi:hypothetical protein